MQIIHGSACPSNKIAVESFFIKSQFDVLDVNIGDDHGGLK